MVTALNRHSIGRFYFNRGIRIFPAWLIFAVGSYVVNLAASDLHPITEGFQFWFLWALLCFYLFSPLLLRLVIWLDLIGIVVIASLIEIVALCGFCGCFPDVSLSFIVIMGVPRIPAFLLGMWVVVNEAKEARDGVPLWVGSFLAVLGCLWRVVWSENLIPESLLEHIQMRYVFCPVYPLVAFVLVPICCFLSSVGRKVERRMFYRLVCVFGACSLELYLWHEWLYIHMGGVMNTRALNGCLCLVLSVIGSFILAWGTHCVCAHIVSLLKRGERAARNLPAAD